MHIQLRTLGLQQHQQNNTNSRGNCRKTLIETRLLSICCKTSSIELASRLDSDLIISRIKANREQYSDIHTIPVPTRLQKQQAGIISLRVAERGCSDCDTLEMVDNWMRQQLRVSRWAWENFAKFRYSNVHPATVAVTTVIRWLAFLVG